MMKIKATGKLLEVLNEYAPNRAFEYNEEFHDACKEGQEMVMNEFCDKYLTANSNPERIIVIELYEAHVWKKEPERYFDLEDTVFEYIDVLGVSKEDCRREFLTAKKSMVDAGFIEIIGKDSAFENIQSAPLIPLDYDLVHLDILMKRIDVAVDTVRKLFTIHDMDDKNLGILEDALAAMYDDIETKVFLRMNDFN